MEQRSYKIYKIYNTVNENIYIGQTVNSLTNRFSQHCECSSSKVGKAIKTLSKDKFKIELLDTSATSNKELSILEDKYIMLYDSINNGYNTRTSSTSSANLSRKLKSTLAITLDEEVLEKLKLFADKEDRTISSQINKILKDYLEEKVI